MQTLNKDKQRDSVKLGLAFFISLSLFALYLYFLNYFAGPIVSIPMDAIESAVFYSMILRALLLFFVPYLRKLQPQFKILIFSFEAFVLFCLILISLVSGDSGYLQLMADLLTAWLGATLIIVTPYSIYELALIMYRGTDITTLAVSSAPLVAICLFLSNLVVRVPNPQGGLSGFGTEMIRSLRVQPAIAGSTVETNSFISGVSAVFFLSIIVYIAYTLNQSAEPLAGVPKYHYALALMLLGSLVLYVWLLASSSLLNGNIFEILSIPAAIIPVILWMIARER
jgi:hypothetical protein